MVYILRIIRLYCINNKQVFTIVFAVSWNENFLMYAHSYCRFRWPCALRCGPQAARLLGLRVRIPAGEWMSVSCECCILSGRGLSASGWSIVQKSPTECGVSKCDREASITTRPWPTGGCRAMGRRIRTMYCQWLYCVPVLHIICLVFYRYSCYTSDWVLW